MIYAFAILAILIAMALVLVRLIKGPTLYDRVLAVNSFGTHTVLLIGVLHIAPDIRIARAHDM